LYGRQTVSVFVIGITIWVPQVQSQLLTGTPPNPLHHHTTQKDEATPPWRALHHLQGRIARFAETETYSQKDNS
jgi:hypothetical protein